MATLVPTIYISDENSCQKIFGAVLRLSASLQDYPWAASAKLSIQYNQAMLYICQKASASKLSSLVDLHIVIHNDFSWKHNPQSCAT